MIKSKQDYLYFLNADKLALGLQKADFKSRLTEVLFPNPIYKFQKLLRKFEYYKNYKTGVISKLYLFFLKRRFRKYSIKLGFSIPENVFGPGLAIVHYGTIVVNANAKVGANCRIHPSTCIGASGGNNKAPQMGNNIYIAPGAKIFGDIVLGNNIAIGANAVVNKSFHEDGILIAGIPAKKIGAIDIYTIIKHIK
jgi:serine O-acetyltransferase